MQLYFIRHGQSTNNLLWDQIQSNAGRAEDPELTENGRLQAKLVAQYLAKHRGRTNNKLGHNYFDFTHLYSSLMVRAMDTANAIAEALDMTPVIWEAIHETGGIWEQDASTGERTGLPGRNRAYFETRYPNFVLPDNLGEAGWWNRPFEDIDGFAARAERVVATLHEMHGGTDDRVAIVSHGGFYNYLLAILLKLSITRPPNAWFTMHNTAITRFDFDGDTNRVRIAYNNRVDFLPAALVT